MGRGGERDKKGKWEGRSGQEEVGSVNGKRNEKRNLEEEEKRKWGGVGKGRRRGSGRGEVDRRK